MSPPHNMSIDTDPHLQEAASPQMVVVRSSSRYVSWVNASFLKRQRA